MQRLLFCILPICAIVMPRGDCTVAQEASLPPPDIRVLTDDRDAGIPEPYRSFEGILLEEVPVIELHSILPYVFFDSANGEIPERYIIFRSPEQRLGFSDTTIPGGTLEKHRQLLNVIGYRMRTHPDTRITIGGYNSSGQRVPEQPGENVNISRQRQQVVYDYLTNIWQIDPNRIELLPIREGAPPETSNPKVPEGREENRRAEIGSWDWQIMKPIIDVELRLVPVAGTLGIDLPADLPDSVRTRGMIAVAHAGRESRMVIEWGSDPDSIPLEDWYTGRGIGLADTPSSFTASLVVQNENGEEFRSAETAIPSLNLPVRTDHGEALHPLRVAYYGLIRFRFDSDEAGPLNDRILKEYLYSEIRPGAEIRVIGYTDSRIGLPDRNYRLSRQRAATVAREIRKNVPAADVASLIEEGVGGTHPLFPETTPEGRFYNRTVIITLKNHYERR